MHASHLSVTGPRSQDQDRPSTTSSNGDTPEHSVHTRSRSTAHTQSPKRLSVFSGRSRSNTTSTSSSRRSPASSMTSADAASIPSSQEDRRGSTAAIRPERHERQESMTKSLFSRGSRILRRQGSKFNIVATLDEEDETEREKSHFFHRHHRSRQSDAHDLKNLISDPFDFHHLTHTSQTHFQGLENTRENDLVTEFSAIRASQRPITSLKGIRAEDIHFRDFSSEDLTGCGTAIIPEDSEDPNVPRAISPPASPNGSSVSPKQQDPRGPRESRIFENFSRPVSRYPRVGSPTPPPRATSPRLAASPDISEPAPRAIDDILGVFPQPTYPEHVNTTNDTEQRLSLTGLGVEGVFPSIDAQAATSGSGNENSRSASVSFTNLSSDLEDVPEEEAEGTQWHDSPGSNVEEQENSHALAEMDRASTNTSKSHLSIVVAEELSRKFSEALGSPTLPQNRPEESEIAPPEPRPADAIPRRLSTQQKPAYETIYESWDADIDYCYEHAAESNCDFDWGRRSLDEHRFVDAGIPITATDLDGPIMKENGGSSVPSMRLTTSTLPTPDLDPSPSRSIPSSHMVVTPSSPGYDNDPMSQRDGDYFQPVSSAMFPPTLGKHITPDTLYEEYLAADAESDRHFSFCPRGMRNSVEQPVSPRSSFSPISKCNSQESLILSRAASIVRKHRSSISATSVPDLVHSLANSRELPAEQVPGDEQLRSASVSGASHPEPSSTSNHRQTQGLSRDIEGQLLFRTAEGNTSLDCAGITSSTVHDRAKSTSEVEAAPLIASVAKPDIPLKSAQRRKGRTTSYSLFPPTAAAN